jgi:hypothetical protein
MAARKPNETIAMTAVTEAVNSIGSSFRNGGIPVPFGGTDPLIRLRRFPFRTAQALFGAVRADNAPYGFRFAALRLIFSGAASKDCRADGKSGNCDDRRGVRRPAWINRGGIVRPSRQHNPGAVVG